MHATVIPSSTGHGAHAGPPGTDPRENIQALRGALGDVDDLRHELDEARVRIEQLEAMELVLRNALHGRNALTAELGLRLVRAEEALADLAAQAWRLERENARLSAENRRLRGSVRRPGLRGRWSR